MNIIDEFVKYLDEKTDACWKFKKLSAYWLVSSCLGSRLTLYLPTGPVRPNVYVVLIGSPGISRKSTIIRTSKRIYAKFLRAVDLDPTDHIVETFTIEGISDHIIENKVKEIAIISEEFSLMIEKIKKARYMSGVEQFLSKLYDGDSYTQHLSGGKKRELSEGVYTTLLAGLQKPEQVPKRMAEQGLTRRMLFVKDDIERDLRSPFELTIIPKFDIQPLVDRYNEILDAETFTFFPGVDKLLDEYYRLMHKEAMKYDDALRDYIENSVFQLTKLSMLQALADMDNRITPDGVMIKSKHVKEAYEFFHKTVLSESLETIREILIRKKEQPILSHEAAISKIISILEERGFCKYRDVLSKLKMTSDEMIVYIKTLLEMDKITLWEAKPQRGRPQRYLVLVDKLDKFQEEIGDIYEIYEVELDKWR